MTGSSSAPKSWAFYLKNSLLYHKTNWWDIQKYALHLLFKEKRWESNPKFIRTWSSPLEPSPHVHGQVHSRSKHECTLKPVPSVYMLGESPCLILGGCAQMYPWIYSWCSETYCMHMHLQMFSGPGFPEMSRREVVNQEGEICYFKLLVL